MNLHLESDKRNNPWRLIHAAWIVLAMVALGIFVASLPAYAQRGIGAQTDTVYDAPPVFVRVISVVNMLASIAAAVTSLGLAFILFRRKPRDPMALYVSFYLLVYGVVAAGPMGMLEGAQRITESLNVFAQAILLTTPTITLFFIFPTGRFVPRWTRWVSVLSLVWIVAGFELVSHLPVAFDLWNLASLLVAILTWTCFAFYGLIYRYRRVSNLVERQQTKWVVLGMTIFLVLTALTTIPYLITQAAPRDTPQPMWVLAFGPTWWLSLNLLPLSFTIAVMRYRLFEIDVIINRALVYGTLTAITVGLYVVIVGFLASLFQATANPIIAFIATGLVAVLFQPLRERLQRGVNRLIHGERNDPYAVLSRLGQRLETTLTPDAILPTIVETIAQTLKLPYAAIALKQSDEFKTVAAYGLATGDPLVLPLTYQSEMIGELVLSPRGRGEDFSPADRHLLDNIARQAGVAAHAVRLTADLQRSREQLVAAREEERRRIRRDLHDGLGPALASLTMKLDAAHNLIPGDPTAASALVAELKKQTQSAIADIRRLVYDLRPPALDELGLASAIREQAMQHNASNGLNVSVHAPDQLPALPAAVEVAAYRIVLEALTNMERHAHARHCVVRLALENGNAARYLGLEIIDDGIGLASGTRAGVGFASMRERAAELGGVCMIELAAGGGTRVFARLPLPKIAEVRN